MPRLSARQIGELVDELAPLVAGARIRDVQAHPPRDLILILERGERVLRLRFSADPEAARLHLQIGRVRSHTGPPGPFYRRARELFEGGEVRALEQLQGDRIVRLHVGGETEAELVAELTGVHANLLLLDGAGAIAGVLVRPKRASDRLREGAEYAPPPGRRAAGAGDGESLEESLPTPEEPGEAGIRLATQAPLSWRVEASLGSGAERRHEESGRRDLVQRLERRLKAVRDRRRGLEERSAACAGAERVRMDADLLVANLSRVKRGMRSLEVEDSYVEGGPARTIELDPRLTPKKNAERLFARYKKLVRSAERLPDELAAAEGEAVLLEELRDRVADPESDWRELEREALESGLLRARQLAPERRRPEPRRPYTLYRASSGAEILVGRSARDNDVLTFRHTRGNDVWLHTADAPGSHVVLRTSGKGDPDPEDVLDAAHLALHFSPLRGARRAEIHVARCKEVRKPKKAPPGLVTLAGGKTRRIRMEEDRLARLLATRGSRGPRGPRGHGAGGTDPR